MNKNIATRMMLASLFLKTKDPDNLLISPSAPKMIREMSPVQKCFGNVLWHWSLQPTSVEPLMELSIP